MALVRFIDEALRRWRRPSSSEAPHLALGRQGEEIAGRFLRSRGYRVLRQNFRGPRGGEVDLVCRDKARSELVFVEVKTRTSEAFGRPLTAVDQKKQRLIIRGAMAWLRMLEMPDVTFRFDVIEVILEGERPEIRHIENAFQLPDSYSY